MPFSDLAEALPLAAVPLDRSIVEYQWIAPDVLAFKAGAPHAMKTAHFCRDLGVRISGRICSKRQGEHAFSFEALQLMDGIWGMQGTNNPIGTSC